MGRFRPNVLVVLVAVVSMALAITPGFGQGAGSLGEPRSERLSSAGAAILFGESTGSALGAAADPLTLAPSRSSSGGSSSGSSGKLIVGPNVRVNAPQQPSPNGLLGRSETTIAASPDGQNLVVGWNDAQGFCGPPFGAACTPQNPPGLSGFGFSTDGGATWTDGGAPPVLRHVFTRGDPWLARGLDGTFFFANLAVHDVTGDDLGVSVHRGRFMLNTFAWEDVQVIRYPPKDFADKEAIATHPSNAMIAAVSLTNFQELCGIAQNGFGQIEVWHTRDGGKNWRGPGIAGPEASDSVAACGFSGTLQQSSVPAFGPDGELFVTWQFGPTFDAAGVASTDADVVVARSLDGGKTFDPPVKVADINSMRAAPPVGYNRGRINDHPRIAVITEGRHRGRVLVVFPSAVVPTTSPSTVQNPTSVNVFLSFSDDGGFTWSAPAAIAGGVPLTGVKRFWPVVTVQGDGVDVVYYESLEQQATPAPADIECSVGIGGGLIRSGTRSSLVNTKIVHSDNGGKKFGAPVTVSTVTSNWCRGTVNIRPNFGDYIGSAAARKDEDNLILPVWADSRNTILIGGVPRNVVDVFFAPVRNEDSSASRLVGPAVSTVSPASPASAIWTWISARLSALTTRRN